MRKIVDIEKQTIAQKRFDVTRLAELIEKGYMAEGREPSDRAKKSFAPSGIGYGSGKCARQWHYALNGGIMREDDTDSVGIANMAYGTEAHARIQKVFENTGILVEAEREIRNEDPPIFGYGDLVINWQGEEAIGEIKTTGPESFVSKRSKMKPAGYHLLQVLIYMKVENVNKGFILYENKATQEMLILPIVWNLENKELADRTWEWMRKVYQAWQDDKLPNRPVRSEKSPECKSCPFTKHCWEDNREVDITIEKLDVPA